MKHFLNFFAGVTHISLDSDVPLRMYDVRTSALPASKNTVRAETSYTPLTNSERFYDDRNHPQSPPPLVTHLGACVCSVGHIS